MEHTAPTSRSLAVDTASRRAPASRRLARAPLSCLRSSSSCWSAAASSCSVVSISSSAATWSVTRRGHGDFGEADRSSISRSANDVWGKGAPELPCGGWGGRPTHARGEGACSRSCAGRPRVSSVTPLRHVGTHTPQRLSLLFELDVGLGHGLGEVARAARLLQQRQQVRAVQDARGGVLADRKRPAREESPEPLHGGRRKQPGIQRLPCRAAGAHQRRPAELAVGPMLAGHARGGGDFCRPAAGVSSASSRA